MAKLTIAAAQRLTLPDDALNLAELDPPEKMSFSRATSKNRYGLAKTFVELWRALIVSGPADYPREPKELWSRLVLVSATHYDALVRSLQDDLPEGENIAPGLNLPALEKLAKSMPKDALPEQRWALGVFFQHTLFQVSATLIRPMAAYPTWGPRGVIEEEAHRHALSLLDLLSIAPNEDLRLCARRLLTSELQQLHEAYEQLAIFNKEHPVGPFSSLRLGELAFLAGRDERVMKAYGPQEASRAFEQQLALLFQSLGFYVVSTRPGERTIDLVCISADPTEPLTALIEAKSTKRSYGLPVDDERALREYIEEVRRSLRTLPALRFVLIVGPSASSTLSAKLGRLEAKVGVPVRFASAQTLATLRERIAGTVPMRVLVDSILTASHVLPPDLATNAVERHEAEQRAHSEFVKTLFDVGGG